MEYKFQVGDLVECAKLGGIDIRITTGMRGTLLRVLVHRGMKAL